MLIFTFIRQFYQKFVAALFIFSSFILCNIFSLVVSLYSSTSISAETEEYIEEPNENLYQIEYIIFEQLNTDRHVLRYEDVRYALPHRVEYLHLLPAEQAMAPNQLKQLPLNEMDLNKPLQRLEKSHEVKVYAFGAWQQEIKKGEKLLPLQIDKDMSAQGGQHLSGEILIRRGRYVHADVNLYLSDFISLPYSDLQTWIFQTDSEKFPFDWLLLPLVDYSPYLEKNGEFSLPQNVTHLHQNRRIKEGEVHYLDHPALGVIIVIKQIDSLFFLTEEDSYKKTDNNANEGSDKKL